MKAINQMDGKSGRNSSCFQSEDASTAQLFQRLEQAGEEMEAVLDRALALYMQSKNPASLDAVFFLDALLKIEILRNEIEFHAPDAQFRQDATKKLSNCEAVLKGRTGMLLKHVVRTGGGDTKELENVISELEDAWMNLDGLLMSEHPPEHYKPVLYNPPR